MIYVTTRQKTKEKQLSWLDLIGEEEIPVSEFVSSGSAGTVTRVLDEATPELLRKINVEEMINVLKRFNNSHENLFAANRKSLYRHFEIPKKTGGGMRPIDAPCDELKLALTELGMILSDKFGVLYHTSAFAYVANRSTVQLVRKHQINESNWFYKTDISGFFPSTTLDFTMKMIKMIFPLSEICKTEEGYNELRKALSLGFLNGVLPQGTPLSPKLTNIIAIPIDHKLFNELAHKRFVYTRYADDLHISCQQKFDPEKMTQYIKKVFKEFGAPWILKPEKTHYGSRKGKNYCLGVCLNAQNNITVGYKTKKIFKAQTANLIMDYKNGKRWPIDEAQQYAGLVSYYKMVEKDYFENLIERFNNKFNVNVKEILKRMTSNSINTINDTVYDWE
jgi:retron-type reverse transcriptase